MSEKVKSSIKAEKVSVDKESSSASGSTPSTPSPGHRSRKEKLVVRSFSTEIDEIQPRILSHEEFFGSRGSAGKRGGSRTRRTASAPLPGARSREHSEDDEDDYNDRDQEEEVGDPLERGEGSFDGEEDGDPKKIRRKRKTRPIEEYDEDFGDDVHMEESIATKTTAASNTGGQSASGDVSSGKITRKSYGKVQKQPQQKQGGRKLGVKRRLEWPSPSDKGGHSRKQRRSGSLSLSQELQLARSSNYKMQKSVLKSSKYMASSSPVSKSLPTSNNTYAGTMMDHNNIRRRRNISENKASSTAKVTFMDPVVVVPRKRFPPTTTCGSMSNTPSPSSGSSPAPTLLAPQRQLVKYKVPEKFARIMQHNRTKAANMLIPKIVEELDAVVESVQDKASEEPIKEAVVESPPQLKVLLPPPPPPSPSTSSSLFTAPQPPDSPTSSNSSISSSPSSSVNATYTISNSTSQDVLQPPSPFDNHHQDLNYTKEQQDSHYGKGLAILQHLMADYTTIPEPASEEESVEEKLIRKKNSKISFTIPDLCRESIASLVHLLAKSPSQILAPTKKKKSKLQKSGGPRTPADKDSSTSASSSGSESEDLQQQADPSSLSILQSSFLSYGRSLVRGTGKMQELEELLKDSSSTCGKGGEYRPNFVLGSYTAPSSATTTRVGGGGGPRLTVAELQVFEELMRPDEHFMLYEDEQELANLYCELVRSELRQLDDDRKMKAEMEGLLQDQLQGGVENSGGGGVNELGTNRKIVDVFPILVKPQDRHHFPAEMLMKQEDFVELITKGKENQLKELNTRRLRNGRQFTLKKIYLRNEGKNKKKDGPPPLSSTTSPSVSFLSRPPPLREASTLPASHVGGSAAFDVNLAQLNLKGGPSSSISAINNTMKLRDGKEIPLRSSAGAGAGVEFKIHLPQSLHGSAGAGVGNAGKDDDLTPAKPDEYSQRVEASLRRLEAGPTTGAGGIGSSSSSSTGGELLESLLMDSSLSSSSSSGRYRSQSLGGRLNNNLFLNSPYSPNYLASSSSNSAISTTPSLAPSEIFNFSGGGGGYNQGLDAVQSNLSPMGQYFPGDSSTSFMFKPIQPYPLSNLITANSSSSGATASSSSFDPFLLPRMSSSSMLPFQQQQQLFSFSGQGGPSSNRGTPPGGSGSGTVGSPLLASPLNKSRYSRQKHSTLCPPFDNNHCSYNYHHCSYPRAPNSRFCIHHVGEGATVNFERCKYVKGSRECGRFIPRSSSQALFCDIHALTIANAHVKKSRSRKTLDKTEGLLKHMRCNLDRAEGKIMEPDGQGSFCVRKDFLEDERETLNNSSNSDESDDDGAGGVGVGGGRAASKRSLTVGALYTAQKGDEDSDVDDCDGPDGNIPDYGTLKTAGYYTVEECVRMSQAALLKQKELMSQELELLKRQYSSGWKNYNGQLRSLRGARLNFTTDPKVLSTNSSGLSMEQIRAQVKVHNDTVASLAHRRNSGPRALLRQSVLRRRQKIFESVRSAPLNPSSTDASGGSITTPQQPLPLSSAETKEEVKIRLRRSRKGLSRPLLCSFGLGTHEKCGERAVPLCRFCFKHITQDKFQKLHVPCNFRLGPDSDDVCPTPVHSLLEKFGCPLHALPIPLKDPPESQNKKAKVEEEIDRLMEEEPPQIMPAASSLSSQNNDGVKEEEEQQSLITQQIDDNQQGLHDEEMIQEMEDLVGDEVVDLDHFRETLSSVYSRGLYVTDSEESEDTEEEEEEPQEHQL